MTQTGRAPLDESGEETKSPSKIRRSSKTDKDSKKSKAPPMTIPAPPLPFDALGSVQSLLAGDLLSLRQKLKVSQELETHFQELSWNPMLYTSYEALLPLFVNLLLSPSKGLKEVQSQLLTTLQVMSSHSPRRFADWIASHVQLGHEETFIEWTRGLLIETSKRLEVKTGDGDTTVSTWNEQTLEYMEFDAAFIRIMQLWRAMLDYTSEEKVIEPIVDCLNFLLTKNGDMMANSCIKKIQPHFVVIADVLIGWAMNAFVSARLREETLQLLFNMQRLWKDNSVFSAQILTSFAEDITALCNGTHVVDIQEADKKIQQMEESSKLSTLSVCFFLVAQSIPELAFGRLGMDRPLENVLQSVSKSPSHLFYSVHSVLRCADSLSSLSSSELFLSSTGLLSTRFLVLQASRAAMRPNSSESSAIASILRQAHKILEVSFSSSPSSIPGVALLSSTDQLNVVLATLADATPSLMALHMGEIASLVLRCQLLLIRSSGLSGMKNLVKRMVKVIQGQTVLCTVVSLSLKDPALKEKVISRSFTHATACSMDMGEILLSFVSFLEQEASSSTTRTALGVRTVLSLLDFAVRLNLLSDVSSNLMLRIGLSCGFLLVKSSTQNNLLTNSLMDLLLFCLVDHPYIFEKPSEIVSESLIRSIISIAKRASGEMQSKALELVRVLYILQKNYLTSDFKLFLLNQMSEFLLQEDDQKREDGEEEDDRQDQNENEEGLDENYSTSSVARGSNSTKGRSQGQDIIAALAQEVLSPLAIEVLLSRQPNCMDSTGKKSGDDFKDPSFSCVSSRFTVMEFTKVVGLFSGSRDLEASSTVEGFGLDQDQSSTSFWNICDDIWQRTHAYDTSNTTSLRPHKHVVAIREAAAWCVQNKLRTHFGGPAQTFSSLERLVQHFLSEQEKAFILRRKKKKKSKKKSLLSQEDPSILTFLLLDFMVSLEKFMYDAVHYKPISSGQQEEDVSNELQKTSVFFKTNKKVVDDWLVRIRPMLLQLCVLHENTSSTYRRFHAQTLVSNLYRRLLRIVSTPSAIMFSSSTMNDQQQKTIAPQDKQQQQQQLIIDEETFFYLKELDFSLLELCSAHCDLKDVDAIVSYRYIAYSLHHQYQKKYQPPIQQQQQQQQADQVNNVSFFPWLKAFALEAQGRLEEATQEYENRVLGSLFNLLPYHTTIVFSNPKVTFDQVHNELFQTRFLYARTFLTCLKRCGQCYAMLHDWTKLRALMERTLFLVSNLDTQMVDVSKGKSSLKSKEWSLLCSGLFQCASAWKKELTLVSMLEQKDELSISSKQMSTNLTTEAAATLLYTEMMKKKEEEKELTSTGMLSPESMDKSLVSLKRWQVVDDIERFVFTKVDNRLTNLSPELTIGLDEDNLMECIQVQLKLCALDQRQLVPFEGENTSTNMEKQLLTRLNLDLTQQSPLFEFITKSLQDDDVTAIHPSFIPFAAIWTSRLGLNSKKDSSNVLLELTRLARKQRNPILASRLLFCVERQLEKNTQVDNLFKYEQACLEEMNGNRAKSLEILWNLYHKKDTFNQVDTLFDIKCLLRMAYLANVRPPTSSTVTTPSSFVERLEEPFAAFDQVVLKCLHEHDEIFSGDGRLHLESGQFDSRREEFLAKCLQEAIQKVFTQTPSSSSRPVTHKAWIHYSHWCFEQSKRHLQRLATKHGGHIELSNEEKQQVDKWLINNDFSIETIIDKLTLLCHPDGQLVVDRVYTFRTYLCSMSLTDDIIDKLVNLQKKSHTKALEFHLAATKGYFQALWYSKKSTGQAFSSSSSSSSSSSDDMIICLRLLRLLMLEEEEICQVFEDNFKNSGTTIPIESWKEIVPQLFARVQHPNKKVSSIILLMLTKVAQKAPHVVLYPSIVSKNVHLIQELGTMDNKLLEDTRVFMQELGRISSLWDEVWAHGLSKLSADVQRRIHTLEKEASRVDNNQSLSVEEKRELAKRKTVAMFKPVLLTLERLWTETCGPLTNTQQQVLTPHEDKFVLTYGKLLAESMNSFQACCCVHQSDFSETLLQEAMNYHESIMTGGPQGGHQPQSIEWQLEAIKCLPKFVWHPFEDMLKRLTASTTKTTTSEGGGVAAAGGQQAVSKCDALFNLEEIAPSLVSLRLTSIPLPGVLNRANEPIQIHSIDHYVRVLRTKTKPKCLEFIGKDGRKYKYLLKSREDLRLDERVMQILRTVNMFLQANPQTSTRHLVAQNYQVTPISKQAGLIQMVPQVIPLFQVYLNGQDQVTVVQTPAAVVSTSTSATKMGPHASPTAAFYARLKHYGIRDVSPSQRHSWPVNILKRVYRDLAASLPRHVLLNEWQVQSSDVQEQFTKQNRFTRSLAVMSVVGYLIGLGDRHLDNMLMSTRTGDIVHIDYNICFEKGHQLKVPEVVPFRLTPMLQDALGLVGPHGKFKQAIEFTLQVLREKYSKETLVSLLDAFVYDPLVEWTTLSVHQHQHISGQKTTTTTAEMDGSSSGHSDSEDGDVITSSNQLTTNHVLTEEKAQLEVNVNLSLFHSRAEERRQDIRLFEKEFTKRTQKVDLLVNKICGQLFLKFFVDKYEYLLKQLSTVESTLYTCQQNYIIRQTTFEAKKQLLTQEKSLHEQKQTQLENFVLQCRTRHEQIIQLTKKCLSEPLILQVDTFVQQQNFVLPSLELMRRDFATTHQVAMTERTCVHVDMQVQHFYARLVHFAGTILPFLKSYYQQKYRWTPLTPSTTKNKMDTLEMSLENVYYQWWQQCQQILELTTTQSSMHTKSTTLSLQATSAQIISTPQKQMDICVVSSIVQEKVTLYQLYNTTTHPDDQNTSVQTMCQMVEQVQTSLQKYKLSNSQTQRLYKLYGAEFLLTKGINGLFTPQNVYALKAHVKACQIIVDMVATSPKSLLKRLMVDTSKNDELYQWMSTCRHGCVDVLVDICQQMEDISEMWEKNFYCPHQRVKLTQEMYMLHASSSLTTFGQTDYQELEELLSSSTVNKKNTREKPERQQPLQQSGGFGTIGGHRTSQSHTMTVEQFLIQCSPPCRLYLQSLVELTSTLKQFELTEDQEKTIQELYELNVDTFEQDFFKWTLQCWTLILCPFLKNQFKEFLSTQWKIDLNLSLQQEMISLQSGKQQDDQMKNGLFENFFTSSRQFLFDMKQKQVHVDMLYFFQSTQKLLERQNAFNKWMSNQTDPNQHLTRSQLLASLDSMRPQVDEIVQLERSLGPQVLEIAQALEYHALQQSRQSQHPQIVHLQQGCSFLTSLFDRCRDMVDMVQGISICETSYRMSSGGSFLLEVDMAGQRIVDEFVQETCSMWTLESEFDQSRQEMEELTSHMHSLQNELIQLTSTKNQLEQELKENLCKEIVASDLTTLVDESEKMVMLLKAFDGLTKTIPISSTKKKKSSTTLTTTGFVFIENERLIRILLQNLRSMGRGGIRASKRMKELEKLLIQHDHKCKGLYEVVQSIDKVLGHFVAIQSQLDPGVIRTLAQSQEDQKKYQHQSASVLSFLEATTGKTQSKEQEDTKSMQEEVKPMMWIKLVKEMMQLYENLAMNIATTDEMSTQDQEKMPAKGFLQLGEHLLKDCIDVFFQATEQADLLSRIVDSTMATGGETEEEEDEEEEDGNPVTHVDELDEESDENEESNVNLIRSANSHQRKNRHALRVIQRVEDKLEGRITSSSNKSLTRVMNVKEQADWLIQEATKVDNLCVMYEGWTPWI